FGQTDALRSWLSPSIPPSVSSGKVAPHWYNPWISRVLWLITPLYFVSIGGTAFNTYTLPVNSARHWLMANFAFTLLHLVPVTKAYANIKIIGWFYTESGTPAAKHPQKRSQKFSR